MKLSSIHKQDLLSLARVFNQPPSLVIRIGERYGYKVAYLYLDTCMSQNKPIQSTIITKQYKLITKIKTHLKQLKTWKILNYTKR